MIPEAACIGDAGHDCDLHSRHIKTSCAKAALWEAAERRVPTEKQMVVLPARTLRTTASAGLESSVASPDQPSHIADGTPPRSQTVRRIRCDQR